MRYSFNPAHLNNSETPFALLLPDIILDSASTTPLHYQLVALTVRFSETGGRQVLAELMEDDLNEYSVITTQSPTKCKRN